MTDAKVREIANEINAVHRKAYAFDTELDVQVKALWRKHQAEGVSLETFQEAMKAARSHTGALLVDYINRLTEAGLERLEHKKLPQ